MPPRRRPYRVRCVPLRCDRARPQRRAWIRSAHYHRPRRVRSTRFPKPRWVRSSLFPNPRLVTFPTRDGFVCRVFASRGGFVCQRSKPRWRSFGAVGSSIAQIPQVTPSTGERTTDNGPPTRSFVAISSKSVGSFVTFSQMSVGSFVAFSRATVGSFVALPVDRLSVATGNGQRTTDNGPKESSPGYVE